MGPIRNKRTQSPPTRFRQETGFPETKVTASVLSGSLDSQCKAVCPRKQARTREMDCDQRMDTIRQSGRPIGGLRPSLVESRLPCQPQRLNARDCCTSRVLPLLVGSHERWSPTPTVKLRVIQPYPQLWSQRVPERELHFNRRCASVKRLGSSFPRFMD
jgi:hypothetical protein